MKPCIFIVSLLTHLTNEGVSVDFPPFLFFLLCGLVDGSLLFRLLFIISTISSMFEGFCYFSSSVLWCLLLFLNRWWILKLSPTIYIWKLMGFLVSWNPLLPFTSCWLGWSWGGFEAKLREWKPKSSFHLQTLVLLDRMWISLLFFSFSFFLLCLKFLYKLQAITLYFLLFGFVMGF